ncbi:MAG: alpha-amylase family glycosyl hydrolase [Lentimicrobium sp.]|jgi:glycosidase|nr:alpha-amylase family glycosyl hydrolase [Lentimicrobium sp.]
MSIKNFVSFLFLILSINFSSAQVSPITVSPLFPSENDLVEVVFDATKGNAGLAGYTEDIYAHTGVLTDSSTGPSNWRYVKTDWGENTEETKLERIGPDLYRFYLTPTVREYYGVPLNEQIENLCFVFRSGVQVNNNWLEGKTETGGDIFYDVYQPGLFAKFISPANPFILTTAGASINIEGVANAADSLFLFLDDELLKSVAGNSLTENITAEATGKHFVKIVATNQLETAVDSFYYYVRQPVSTMELPAGIVDGINYLDDNTAVLCLYAPEKEYAFVLGDFNNWEFEDAGYLHKTPDGNRYWIQLNNLVPGQEYIFQYLVDGEIRIGDPYAEKVSDPWNDKFISEATYPGILPYPSETASGVATVLQTAQPEYLWETTNFQSPQKSELIVYELLIRDFVAKHDYQTLIDTLSYLKSMGINAVELMPVNEFEGNLSWGYNPNYYFAPDKYYGPADDLKYFIDECHKQGIAVIIDMVLNHSFGTSPMVMLYWDAANNRPAENNPWFNPEAKHDYNVGFDFNHESPATKALVNRVVRFWIENYKIDGYRFDLSKGFTQTNTLGNTGLWGQYDASRIAIWKNIADTIWSVKEDTYIILEHFADNSEEKVLANYGMMLWGNSNSDFANAARGASSGNNFSWASYVARGWNEPNLISYMESHDEQRIMYRILKEGILTNPDYKIRDTTIALERVQLANVFFYSIPGPKMLWQFGELGYDYSIDFNGRTGEKPIRWDYTLDYRRRTLKNVVSSMIKLRQEHNVFKTTDFATSLAGYMKSIVLKDTEMDVVVAGNFNVTAGTMSPGFTKTGMWYEYFTGDSLNIEAVSTSIELDPGEYKLFSTKKLTRPQTGLGINPEEQENIIISIPYPNPASSELTIPIFMKKPAYATIDLYDIAGRTLGNLYSGQLLQGQNDIRLNPQSNNLNKSGVYLVRIKTNGFVKTFRIVLK